MARTFVTGTADGLGRPTALTLPGHGHEVVVRARTDYATGVAADAMVTP